MESSVAPSQVAVTAARFWGELLRNPRYDRPKIATQLAEGAITNAKAEELGLSISDISLVYARNRAGLDAPRIDAFERALASLVDDALARDGSVAVEYRPSSEPNELLFVAAQRLHIDLQACPLFPATLIMWIAATGVEVFGTSNTAEFHGKKPLIEQF